MITTCTMKEYPALLNFLDEAFNKPEKHWFARNLENIFQNSRASTDCQRIVKEDGKIIGGLGLYPLNLRIGRSVIKVCGIGNVAVAPEHRSKGIMTQLLNHAVETMVSQNYDLSWLAGDRFRYGNFGWDLGGREIVYQLSMKDLRRYYPGSKPAKLCKPEPRHIPELDSIYSGFSSGVERSTDSWEIQLGRKNFGWLRIDNKSGSNHAYLCYDLHQPSKILEVGGDRLSVVSLLLQYGVDKKIEELHVHSAVHDTDPLDGLLFESAFGFHVTPCGMIKVVSIASAWKKLVPEILRTPSGAAIGRSAFDKVKNEKDLAFLLKRTLGFMDSRPLMPNHLKAFETLRPLKWWISKPDTV